MDKHIIIYTFLGCFLAGIPFSVSAQSDLRELSNTPTVRFVPGSAILRTNPATGMSFQSVGSPFAKPAESLDQENTTDGKPSSNVKASLEASNKNEKRNWGELHGSVGLSVMAGFGKGAPKGAGFAQNVDLYYTAPLGKRGWLTAGGYMNHLNWDGMNVTTAGLYGEIGYQVNDNLSAFVYGQKSLANNGLDAIPYYGYSAFGYDGFGGFGYPGYNPYADRVGAGLRWAPSKNFSIQLSVEKDWMPRSRNGYYRKYDYQR